MSKKLIAAMLALTAVFVCVFAACNNDKDEDDEKEIDTRPYVELDEYDFVTDNDGNIKYNEYGEFIVYATDEDGKRVTNEAGEEETLLQQFRPLEYNGIYEDYGYKIKLPEGWKSTKTSGKFVNKSKSQEVSISVVDKTYGQYLGSNLEMYNLLSEQEGIEATWDDNVKLSGECKKPVRFTLSDGKEISVMYFYENSGNVYKVLFKGPVSDTAVEDCEAVIKAMDYKPHAYFPTTTGVDGTTAAEGTTAAK